MITKEEFKRRWESDDDAGGLTYRDIADCYVNWKLRPRPETKPPWEVRYQVLKAANVIDAEYYNFHEEEEEEDE